VVVAGGQIGVIGTLILFNGETHGALNEGGRVEKKLGKFHGVVVESWSQSGVLCDE
jgi:hypothetical protein